MTTQKIRNAVEQFIADGFEYMYDDRDLMNVDLYRTAIIDAFVASVTAGANCTVETLDQVAAEWVAANLPPVEEEVE